MTKLPNITGLSFHHPIAYWIGCFFLSFGVLLHLPMLQHAAHMNYHLAGMPMDTNMLTGMILIFTGILLAIYGLTPRIAKLKERLHDNNGTVIHFHHADDVPLNHAHWSLIVVLFLVVAVDVMKPATLGFVMPGVIDEYTISKKTAGQLALVALIGTTIGSVIWGILADAIGRRAVILLSALIFIGTAICGAMPEFKWNLLMCFLMGMSAGGLLPIAFTLIAEVIPAKHRGWLLVLLGGAGTSAGYLIASSSAMVLVPMFSWRILWLLGLPTGILVIILDRYIPESPRFLANSGLINEARAVLARFNKNITFEITKSSLTPKTQIKDDVRFRQLVQKPYRNLTVGLILCGVTWGLINFGFMLWLPTNLRSLGFADADKILAKSAVLAIPGIILATWLYYKWSSIKTLVLFICITVASMLAFAIADIINAATSTIIMLLIAILLISANGIIAMLIPYATEIYPVQLRGTGSGTIAASSKFGGIIAAILGVSTDLLSNMTISAILIAVPMAVTSIILFTVGVDTRGRKLEEIEYEILSKTQQVQ